MWIVLRMRGSRNLDLCELLGGGEIRAYLFERLTHIPARHSPRLSNEPRALRLPDRFHRVQRPRCEVYRQHDQRNIYMTDRNCRRGVLLYQI